MLKNMQETLEYAFDVLNKVYFNGELPNVVITIMSSPRTNGHFTTGKVWVAEQDALNEINISAEHLNRPIENICATLCHEMVHFYCQLHDIQDTSQYGRYHNKSFRKEAQSRGLSISYAKGIGWSVTSPTQEFIKVLSENNIEKPLEINRDGEKIDASGLIGMSGKAGKNGNNGIVAPTVKKPKCSTRKYVCSGGCGCSFRATKEIHVMCLDCLAEYVVEEK